MREFIVETVLPLASVCLAIAGVTVTVFDVPSAPPPVPSVPRVDLTPAVIPDTPSKPMPTSAPRRAQINDVLGRAVQTLTATAPAPAAAGSAAPRSGAAALPLGAPAPVVDPHVFGVVSRLGEAMKIARDAKDDRDLAKAEELMRSAREEMDSACSRGGGEGPLCQSADQIRGLGY